MSRDRAALLAGVLADPDADLPRLVFADWLDENGDPDCAEFIRAQVELAGMNEWDDGAAEVDIRCEELLRLNRAAWLDGFPDTQLMLGGSRFHVYGGYGDEWPGWTVFDRGFPGRLQAVADSVVSLGERASRSGPLRGVSVHARDKPPRGGYHQFPGVERLRDLRLFGINTTSGTRAAVKLLDRATGLRVVDFSGCRVGEPDALALLGTSAVRNATDLSICGTPLSDEGERRFAAGEFPHLRRLTRVWVPHVDWLSAPWVPQLESLTIHDTEPFLTDDQGAAVADILPGSNVRELELEWWPMSDATAARFGAVDSAAGLRSLALAPMGRATADTIRSALGNKPHLRTLILSHATLTPEFVAWLAASDLGQQLRTLRLDSVRPDGLAALADSKGFPELRTLGLGIGWTLQPARALDTLRRLLTPERLPNLRCLYLTDNDIVTSGVPRRDRVADAEVAVSVVLRCEVLPRLRRLGLFLGPIRPSVGRLLAEAKALDALRVLDANLEHTSKAETRTLLESRFGARVRCY